MAHEALDIAAAAGRKDLEAQALEELAEHLPRSSTASTRRRRRSAAASSSPRRAAASSPAPRRCTRSARCISSAARRTRRAEPRRGAVAVRRGRRRVDARAHAQLACLGGRAARRRRRVPSAQLREAIRLLKPLEDRGALCESQRALAEVLDPARPPRRGRAARARGDRDRRRARPLLAGDDDDVARARARGAGTRRGGRGAAAARRSRSSSRPGFRGLEVWILTRLEEFLPLARPRRGGGRLRRAPRAELAPARRARPTPSPDRIERIA